MTVHSDIQLWELWDTATSALINDRSRHRFAELDTGDLVCGMGGEEGRGGSSLCSMSETDL